MNKPKLGDLVEFTFYGKLYTGTVTDVGTSGKVVFIDGHRWMHTESVKVLDREEGRR